MQNASVTIRRRWERLSREFSVVYEIMVFAANAKLDNLKMLAVRVCVCVCVRWEYFLQPAKTFPTQIFLTRTQHFQRLSWSISSYQVFVVVYAQEFPHSHFRMILNVALISYEQRTMLNSNVITEELFGFFINFVAINVEQTWNFSTYFSFIFDLNFYYFLFSTLKNGCWHVDWPKSESKPMSA